MHDIGRGMELWSLFVGMVVVSFSLAVFTKSTGHMNYAMDLGWMFSVWLEAFALLPQVRLLFMSSYVDVAAVHFAGLTLLASLIFGFFLGKNREGSKPRRENRERRECFL